MSWYSDIAVVRTLVRFRVRLAERRRQAWSIARLAGGDITEEDEAFPEILSPLIANMVLASLDDVILRLNDDGCLGLGYWRYCDYSIILHCDKATGLRALDTYLGALAERNPRLFRSAPLPPQCGLRGHGEKTRDWGTEEKER